MDTIISAKGYTNVTLVLNLLGEIVGTVQVMRTQIFEGDIISKSQRPSSITTKLPSCSTAYFLSIAIRQRKYVLSVLNKLTKNPGEKEK
jgi:hypothetical protein